MAILKRGSTLLGNLALILPQKRQHPGQLIDLLFCLFCAADGDTKIVQAAFRYVLHLFDPEKSCKISSSWISHQSPRFFAEPGALARL